MYLVAVGIVSFGCLARSGGKSHGAGEPTPLMTCGSLNRHCGISLWSRPTVGIDSGGRGNDLLGAWDWPLERPSVGIASAYRGNGPLRAWD